MLILTVPSSSPALAHRLHAFVSSEGHTISGEVYFQDGTPAANARIKLEAQNGSLVAETISDRGGKFALGAVAPGRYTLLADAGFGHLVKRSVEVRGENSVHDLLDKTLADADADLNPSPRDTMQVQGPHVVPTSGTEASLEHHAEKVDQLKKLLDELRDLRVEVVSLQAMVEKHAARARLQDIIGGVGYIVGVMALLYFVKTVTKRIS